MMDILRNHPGGICMHGGFETTSAMVSELREGKATHWLTGDDGLGMLGMGAGEKAGMMLQSYRNGRKFLWNLGI